MKSNANEFFILGSASPRRRELLRQAGLKCCCLTPRVDEDPLPGERPPAYVRRVAADKARAILLSIQEDSGDHLILTGDTTVTLEGAILGKPADAREAADMLLRLSGKTHQVITGVCLLLRRRGRLTDERLFAVSTDVVFRPLSEEEVHAYIRTGDPMDKAGAYGIQSGAAHLIREIRGSFTNVVGFPMAEICEALRELGLYPAPTYDNDQPCKSGRVDNTRCN